jgi:hypothetical protein
METPRPHDPVWRANQIANALGVTLTPNQRHTLEQIVMDIQITTRRQQVRAAAKGHRN